LPIFDCRFKMSISPLSRGQVSGVKYSKLVLQLPDWMEERIYDLLLSIATAYRLAMTQHLFTEK